MNHDPNVNPVLTFGLHGYKAFKRNEFWFKTTKPMRKGGQMNKAELIEKMAKDAKLSKAATARALESFIDGVTKGLKKRNSRVTLVGFGTFRNSYRKTRKGRNPQTGEKIKIKGKNVVKFKAGKTLREKV
jgi:DNA-binding protein HU-beta